VGFNVTNLGLPSRAGVRFYNKQGDSRAMDYGRPTADALDPAVVSSFPGHEVGLQSSVLACDMWNLWRLVPPKRVDHWSLTSLQQTGGRRVSDW